jgi:organic hydroperoxide reductase OsmC/OhrA
MIIVMLAREAGEEGHNSQELAAAAAAACWCGSLDVLESCRFGF